MRSRPGFRPFRMKDLAMSDAPTERPNPRGGGPAYRSQLEPFVDFIRQQRQQRKTWKPIAQLLTTQKGCPITFQGVHQFYRRYVKRSARFHWEREALLDRPTLPAKQSPLASIPPARSFKTVDPARINLNDLTQP